ncbi:MAG: DUF3368 domain-containing protein [Methylomonas sp.]|nr:DUF3368 domain-containing protein [Methylomonas sp.]
MKIVLNTSPIIFLSKIDALTLLADCFAEIFTSPGVVNELRDFPIPTNIKVRSLSSPGNAYVQGALGRLHQGELEAIVLAQELLVDYVILDDLLARRKAQRLGIKVMGTLGVMLLLNKRGLLSAEETWQKISLLTKQHGLYLSPLILQQIETQLVGSFYQ